MSRGINKAILIGNLGNDPDVRYTPTGAAVANVSLATSEGWQDKQSGEWQERTEWHRVVFFGRQAEVVKQYLRKGSKIYVEGRIQTEKWQDNQGQERYTTKIHAFQMQMLDSRNEGAGGGAPGYGAQGAGSYGGAPASPYDQQPGYPASPPNQGMDQPPASQPPASGDEGMNQASPATSPPPDKGFDQDVPF